MEQPKVKIVLLDINKYDRTEVADAYENAVFETYNEARDVFGDEALIFDLSVFMDECNNQEINLGLYWLTYITIN